MILVYSEHITNRLKYACGIVFTEIMGLNVTITSDLEEFEKSDGVKINYSGNDELPGINILPHGLLFERKMKPLEIEKEMWDDLPVIFVTEMSLSVPFDLLSAAFYLVTRYEEYLPFQADQFGRFEASHSMAYKFGFLNQPIVDQWVMRLRGLIQNIYQKTEFPTRNYRFISTIDVDSAYAYRAKGILRAIGSTMRDVVRLDGARLSERFKVWFRNAHDPYNTFDEMINLHQKHNTPSIFFFLLSDFGRFDKNVSHTSRRLQSQIKSVVDYGKVGIHLGFETNNKEEKIPEEINRLEQITHLEITKNRQHYLKLSMPETFRMLLKNGITEDHTMGFAEQIGFRAGTCTPHQWYDLELETKTELKVVPFAVMEATLIRYMKLNMAEAKEEVTKLSQAVREVHGQMVTLWHNESLSERGQWVGWSPLYQEVLKICKT